MLLGLAVLLALVLAQDLGVLLALFSEAGWPLLLLPVLWCPALLLAAESWRLLFPPGRGPLFFRALLASWTGRSVNTLLPVANIGGELVRARLVMLWGSPGVETAASLLVDKTVQAIAVILWALLGIVLLLASHRGPDLAWSLLFGVTVLIAGVAGFFLVQRSGLFTLLARLARRLSGGRFQRVADAGAVDRAVLQSYRDGARFSLALLLRTVSLIVQTGEVWAACWLLGQPITLMEAMILKSLTATVVDLAFLIPNGYGVQEGAYILVGALLGLGPERALAVSLAVRLRELLIDAPGLVYWQQLEGRRWRRRAARRAARGSTR